MIYLSGSILFIDIGIVGVEAKNLFLLFITRASHELRYYIIILIQELVSLLDRYSLSSNLVTYKATSILLSLSLS
jgi:hypothetical protein